MRILVTAASRHDSTRQVAEAIAETLANAGIDVVLRRPEEVGHLTGYDGVVLGSAIYGGHWLKPAKDLVERTSTQLRRLPVWLFSTGPVGDPLKPADIPADVAPLLEQSGARAHRLFGGRLDRQALGLAEKAIVQMTGVADGDRREWGEIDAWATRIAVTLVAAVPANPAPPYVQSRRAEVARLQQAPGA